MRVFSAILPGLILVLALGVPLHAAAAQENNYIAVTGSGEAQQWPDYATVTASVEATEKTTREAVAKTIAMLRTLAGDLKKMGIPEKGIEFVNPSVRRKEERVRQQDGEYRAVTTGYEAGQDIWVTVHDLGRVGEIITVLTNRGAQISPGAVSFEVNDPGKLDARARSLAIADGRQKAEDYTKGSGRRLGKLLIVEESAVQKYRLHPTLREQITGLDRSFPSGTAHTYRSGMPLTPQPVISRVTLYVKFGLQ